MILIGLGYKKRSGKDTVADYLVQQHGFRKMAFADALKAAAAEIFGFSREQLYGELKDVEDPFWGFSPGYALQKLGTEGGRQVFGEDLWIRVMSRRIAKLPAFISGVVITDVRFPNEAAMILAKGGRVYRVDRPEQGGGQLTTSVTALRSASHPSETSMDSFSDWSGVITNDGTLRDLYEKANALVRAK